jgi:hypothetical protein
LRIGQAELLSKALLLALTERQQPQIFAVEIETRLRQSESESPPSLREEQLMHMPMHLKQHYGV